MSFKYYDPELYKTPKKSEGSELYDYTEEFIDTVRELANKPGFGGIFWIFHSSSIPCFVKDLSGNSFTGSPFNCTSVIS